MNQVTDSNKGLIRQTNEALILSAAEKVFARAGFGGATMAAIAEASGLPKANLHYYFGSKDVLYREVLARTLNDWLEPTHCITRDADPRTALEQYIRAKMDLSAQRPDGSKVFANELLDAMPCERFVMRGGVARQLGVGCSGDGFTWQASTRWPCGLRKAKMLT